MISESPSSFKLPKKLNLPGKKSTIIAHPKPASLRMPDPEEKIEIITMENPPMPIIKFEMQE
jgi:hypothetical protein